MDWLHCLEPVVKKWVMVETYDRIKLLTLWPGREAGQGRGRGEEGKEERRRREGGREGKRERRREERSRREIDTEYTLGSCSPLCNYNPKT